MTTSSPRHTAVAIIVTMLIAAASAHAEEINTRIGKIETINGFPTA